MNPEKMKRMDSPQRLQEFNLPQILELMDFIGDETVVDIGAGTGAFSLPIAEQLPNGTVFSLDVDETLIALINDKIKAQNIKNITPILIGDSMPMKENSADKLFISTVFHEIEDKLAFLKSYHPILKESGKLYMVEFISGKRSLSSPNNTKKESISPKDAEQFLLKSGYQNITLAYQNDLIYLMVASK